MAAGKYNMLVQQGATYSQTITLKDNFGVAVNITGCTAAAQIRQQYSDPTPAAQFTCVIPVGTDGVIRISLTPAQTAAITFDRGVYDLELTYPSGVKDRILQGNVVISKEVTR